MALLCSRSDRVRVERRGGACSLPRRTMALGWCGRRCCDAAPHGMERPWKRPLHLLHSNLARPACIKVAGTIFLPISPPPPCSCLTTSPQNHIQSITHAPKHPPPPVYPRCTRCKATGRIACPICHGTGVRGPQVTSPKPARVATAKK